MNHFRAEDIERMESYENVHLRGAKEGISREEKIGLLEKRDRNKWYMLLFNVLAILFFSYSWANELSELSDTIFLILLVVFSINVGLIFLQKKQIRELMEYYRDPAVR
ncbi:MAG: hypothetical protein WDZ29_01775 [Balneolaceae bacterium]